MVKKNLKKLLLTSAVILLPVLLGLLLWDRLPSTMNIHWGADGQADGAAGKAFAVFLPSVVILATHWLCVIITGRDMKGQSPKALNLILWLCPVLSLCIHSLLYTVALGLDVNMGMLLFMPMGLLFAVMGNHMPKFRRNSTMGIKTVWALADDENWFATHRFGGRVWMAGGLLVCVLSCLPWDWAAGLTFVVIFTFAFAPVIYSWLYHRKQVREGRAEKNVPRNPRDAAVTRFALIFTAVIILAVGIVLFTGSVTVTCGDSAFTVDASYWEAVTVDYADVDSIEFRAESVDGARLWGWGSARLLLGTFQNGEFGSYTRYTYTGDTGCVILTVGEKILVIADKDTEATRALYEQLLEKMG